MGRRTDRVKVLRHRMPGDGEPSAESRVDTLAVEEPLEIRVDSEPFTLTMRTPGDDVELAHGLLRAEGVITTRQDVRTARFCTDTGTLNVLDLALTVPGGVPLSSQRSLAAFGGCGLCGSTTVDAVTERLGGRPVDGEGVTIPPAAIGRALEGLKASQKIFARTGGTHGAAAATVDGAILHAREDVGRHNAVDKVLGAVLLGDEPPPPLLVVSSRASFEIVAKAAVSRVPVLACVSAPSSLAVEAAERLGVTLVAFARADRLTVCTHPGRVAAA